MSVRKPKHSYTPKRVNGITRSVNAEQIKKRLQNTKRFSAEEVEILRAKAKARKRKQSSKSLAVVFCSIVVVLAIVFISLRLLKPDNTVAETIKIADNISTEDLETSIAVEDSTMLPVEEETSEIEVAVIETTTERIIADPPSIYGVTPITIYEGHTVAYKSGIYLYSEVDDSPTLKVDNSNVDLFTPGEYEVIYTASDKYGNKASVSTTLTVLQGEQVASDEEIKELGQKVLDAIISEDMTDEMKCLEVYKYLHQIGYVDIVHSKDWMQNAYWTLYYRAGDCYGYYASARLLLTMLGYDVMEIENNNGFTHYWCLVSIDKGETWWHFDATCWSWGEDGVLCLVSDNYITAYANRHMISYNVSNHSWDREKFPATPEEDFWTDEDRNVIYKDGYIQMVPNGDFITQYNDYYDWYNDYEYYEESSENETENFTDELPSDGEMIDQDVEIPSDEFYFEDQNDQGNIEDDYSGDDYSGEDYSYEDYSGDDYSFEDYNEGFLEEGYVEE